MAPPAGENSDRPDAKRPKPYEDFKRRLGRLGERLEGVREKQAAKHGKPDERRGSALGAAFRLGTELLAGVIVGGAMGWFLDWLLGKLGFDTSPVLFILFLLFGMAAGILNAVRVAKQMQEKD